MRSKRTKQNKKVQKKLQNCLFQFYVVGTLGLLSILLFLLTNHPAFKLVSFAYPAGALYFLIKYWVINYKNPEKETCENQSTDI